MVLPVATESRIPATALVRVWRTALVLVPIFAVLNWVGWATRIQVLVRVNPGWPPMTPWTALVLALLAIAILLQSGSPSSGRVWVGRGVAAAVAVFAVVILAEYVTGRSFGVDQVWFSEAVREVQQVFPGRPSPRSAASVLFLAIAVVFTRVARPWARMVWIVCLAVAMFPPYLTIVAYLFGSIAKLEIAPGAGMSLASATGLLLLGAADVSQKPEWLIAGVNRISLNRSAVVFAALLLVGLARRVLMSPFGLPGDLALTFSAAVGALVLAVVTYRLSNREQWLLGVVARDRALSRASLDGMLDPQVLLEAMRDSSGKVTDFVYVEVNQAACDNLGLSREGLLGRRLSEMVPGVSTSELIAEYAVCLDTGEPVILDDTRHHSEILDDTRRYDVRVTRATPSAITITWRDVTDRCEMTQALARSRERLQQQTDLLNSEVRSAADYVASILPGDLTGPVRASSRYLPSRELSGDCFDYRWVDDDHLSVYLIDVSGHGIEPALLSISVHNMLRSDVILRPGHVLSQLNRRFPMERQNGHYFTIWFGVYERSTRTLRYASAGSPPALAFCPGAGTTVLSTVGRPIGMFDDSEYSSESYSVPPGCRMLIYSDGAYEFYLESGQQLPLDDFTRIVAAWSGSSRGSLDELVDDLRALTPAGDFEDDCSLIELNFD